MTKPQLSDPAVAPSDVSSWIAHAPQLGNGAWVRWREGLAMGTVREELRRVTVARSAHIAVVVEEEALTYAELGEQARKVASRLRGLRLPQGSRIAVCGPNSANLVVACVGVVEAGMALIALNPSLTPAEVRHIIEDSGASAVLCDDRTNTTVAEAARDVGSVEVAVLDLLARGGPDVADAESLPVEVGAADLALLQYTSGTTGAPKGAVRTHGQMLAHLRINSLLWDWTADDVLVHSLPLAHGHGLNGVFTALLQGATAVVHARTDPAKLAASMVEHRATVHYSVPAIWERVLSWDGFDPAAFATLRLYTSGSAPLSVALAERVRAALGSYPLERYGSTEAGPSLSNPLRGPRLPGSVGTPSPGVELRVVDAAGQVVPDGEPGEALVRSPAVFGGYWARAEATAAVMWDGWYRTGDVVRMDPTTRRYSITGRTRDMIITGGLNVYPREIEERARSFPGVLDAGIVGLPSPQWGEEVALALVCENGVNLDPEKLRAFLREGLAGYKIPKRLALAAQIPRNATGKILRQRLVEDWETLEEIR